MAEQATMTVPAVAARPGTSARVIACVEKRRAMWKQRQRHNDQRDTRDAKEARDCAFELARCDHDELRIVRGQRDGLLIPARGLIELVRSGVVYGKDATAAGGLSQLIGLLDERVADTEGRAT